MRRPVRPLEWAILALITLAAAALRLILIGKVAPDPFYDAAVRSMGLSWHNFFFGAFEPAASVSIDKPPVDLWLQVASVKLFGFSTSTLKLPEALSGIAAVPLLFLAVRRIWNPIAGLAAAASLAVLPVEVITSRSDTMDGVMMVLIVLALLFVVRACESGRTGWLLAGAAALGLAFDVKILESLVALPGLALLALLGFPGSIGKRALKLAAAGAVYVLVALAWLTATLFVPSHDRPWAIGSTNGSAWNAVFVFNGKDRLGGKSPEPGGREYEPGHKYPVATQSQRDHIPILPPSPTRLLARVGPLSGERLGLELLAALLLGVPALLCGVMLRRRRLAGESEDDDADAHDDADTGTHTSTTGRADANQGTAVGTNARGDEATQAVMPRERTLNLAFAAGLGLWLLTGIVLFSHMVRLHPRYVEGVVPAVAAVLGIGAAWAAEPRGRLRPAALLIALAAVVYYGERLLYGTPGVWWISSLAALAALAAAALARLPALPAAASLAARPRRSARAEPRRDARDLRADRHPCDQRPRDRRRRGRRAARRRARPAVELPARAPGHRALRGRRAVGHADRRADRQGRATRRRAHELRREGVHHRRAAQAEDRRRRSALRLPQRALSASDLAEKPGLLAAGQVDPRTRHRRLAQGRPAPQQGALAPARSRAVSDSGMLALDQALVAEARAAGRLGIDTEFVGEGRYRTLLCLIQLAVPHGDGEGKTIVVLDPLAEGFDGSSLAALLADPAIEIVVHAGRQDVALARRVLGTDVTNVFDTQVAAGFAGLGAQSSYDSLLGDVLDVRVAKSASFTRWERRPLSDEQLSYAREDVEHLLELAAELERRLAALGRLEWAREECEPLARASDERDPEAIFQRLPRVRGLSPSARPVARALVQWREQTAARQDRPVQGVLGDAALMEIAKRKPGSTGELEQIRGSGAANLRRRGEELIEVVKRARELPAEKAPREERPPTPRPRTRR